MKVMITKGRRVRDPKTKKIIPEGSVVDVPVSTYWYRRIKDGDATEAKEAALSSKK